MAPKNVCLTLQNICLTVIVESVERYYAVYSTSKDANLKRNFEFLQKVFSIAIATKMYEKYEMEEKYIDLLISKYTEILNTNWFNKCPWETVVAKMAEVGPNIKKIHFHECSGDRPWQEVFCHLPNLEVIQIYHFRRHCADEILRSIPKFCPNILEIDTRSSFNITENGWKSLCKKKIGKVTCPKLKNLFVESREVTNEVAKYLLKRLPTLEIFGFHYLPYALYSMHKQNLTELDKIPPYNLNKLDLFPSALDQLTSPIVFFTDLLKVCLSVCPFVTSLSCPVLEPQHLDLLSGFSLLKTLHLHCHYTEYLDIDNLLKSAGGKLTSLTICKCSLSVLTLAESCGALKTLSMLSVSFKQYDGSIPLFHNLEALSVEKTKIYSDAANLKAVRMILSSSPNLESVTLLGCHLTSSQVVDFTKYLRWKED